jgi:hypothetical protein
MAVRRRAENVDDPQERDRMLASIAEMDSMIGETLQFARDEAKTEIRRPTDIAALVQSIVDDLADAGMPVKMEPIQPIVYDCLVRFGYLDRFKRELPASTDGRSDDGRKTRAAGHGDPDELYAQT